MNAYTREHERRRVQRNIEVANAKKRGANKGRMQIKIDPFLFDRVASDYRHGKIFAEQATEMLKISKSTFFRRLKGIR